MKIKSFILKNLDIKQEESLKISLLFLHSFFLGIFLAFYFAPANAVFIHHFGSETLPMAYMLAGLGGYLLTSFYSFLQKKVNSKILFLSACSFMLILPILSRVGLFFVPEKWLSLFVFIWGWPFISLVAIESGGLAISFLDLRQVKRLYGLINMGGVMGSIFGYLFLPLLRKVLSHSYDNFFFGVFGVGMAIFFLIYLFKKFPPKQDNKKDKEEIHSKTKVFKLVKERYYKLIFLSATLSMMAIYFADFSFLSGIKVQKDLLSTPQAVADFIALVFGCLKIGELLLSYFSSRILSKHGIKLGLTILPITTTLLMLMAGLAAAFAGVLSMLFLGFIVLNKCAERILRRGLDDPSFNILYQPLPDDQKLAVQTRVGVIMQLSTALAGLFLFVLTEVLKTSEGFNLKYFILLLIPVLLAWVFSTNRLYKAYKDKLREILGEKSFFSKKGSLKYTFGSDMLEKKLKVDDLETQKLAVTILSETYAKIIDPYTEGILEKNDPIMIKSILRKVDPTWNQDLINPIATIYNTATSEEIKDLASRAMDMLDFTDTLILKPEEIANLKYSPNHKDKLTLVKYLFNHTTEDDEYLIFRLLEDEDRMIKSAAIRLAGKRNYMNLNFKLLEIFEHPEYYHICASTFIEMGDSIVQELESFFDKNTSESLLLKIIEVYARIGTPLAKSLLINHLYYPSKLIQQSVVKALYFMRFQATDVELPVIKQKLRDTVENILWIFVSIYDIETQTNTLKLIQALDLERENNFEMLFDILSFIYDPATTELIKINIKGENIIFALEIIDNFISQEIKEMIIPILDKISVSQRLKKLYPYFPMQRMHFNERLKEILVIDYNKVDAWTKARTIELLGKLHKRKKTNETVSNTIISYDEVDIWSRERAVEILNAIRKSEMPDEIFLCLFHPDELVYGTAAKIIYDENPAICIEYLTRFYDKKRSLIRILAEENDEMLIDRVKYIKRVPMFFIVPEYILVKLAKLLQIKNVKKGETIKLEQGANKEEKIIIIIKGKAFYKTESEQEYNFGRDDIIIRGLNIPEQAKALQVKGTTVILEGLRHEYFNLLIDETEILQYIIEKASKMGNLEEITEI